MDQSVKVVSRLQWGAADPRERETLEGPARRVIIHHTALKNCQSFSECKEELRLIQRFHMRERRFDDIGYNFLVGGDGTLYEGRGWGVVGAHTKGNNHDSLGIAFMGNFNNIAPSTEAILAVQRLLRSALSVGYLKPEFDLLGHRDLGNTECPGEKLYALLSSLK